MYVLYVGRGNGTLTRLGVVVERRDRAARWHAGSLTRTLSRTSSFARTLLRLRG